MGSIVAGQRDAPTFRVSAAGAFEQKPGCPEFVSDAMGPERLMSICLGECYHPSDRRHTIDRLEIVRIRAQGGEDEPIGSLIEDPWRVFECEEGSEECRAEWSDPEFALEAASGREVIYYARAIQASTDCCAIELLRDAATCCRARCTRHLLSPQPQSRHHYHMMQN